MSLVDDTKVEIERLATCGKKVLADRRKARCDKPTKEMSSGEYAGLKAVNQYHYNNDLFHAIAEMIVKATKP